jgi:hypothetical protein
MMIRLTMIAMLALLTVSTNSRIAGYAGRELGSAHAAQDKYRQCRGQNPNHPVLPGPALDASPVIPSGLSFGY